MYANIIVRMKVAALFERRGGCVSVCV